MDIAGIAHERITLPTGVTLSVALGGDRAAPPILFLHGFPESHRTWRHQLADLATSHFVVAPDQRGFGDSDRPQDVDAYRTDKPVADLFALADALGIDRFTLVGHDWGGAVAWSAALARPDRIERLIIINAPHPLIFQRTLIDDQAQRMASQYIRLFRSPGIETHVERIGMEAFFDTSIAPLLDLEKLGDERAIYIAQWSRPGALTAMLNWYRATGIVVPAPDEQPERPAWIDTPFPTVKMPTLVLWALDDRALLPCQLEGLPKVVEDLSVQTIRGGHFAPWEQADTVTAAIREFGTTRPA